MSQMLSKLEFINSVVLTFVYTMLFIILSKKINKI
ncbi:unnamed protein product [Brugia pahangi]|uniref:ABC transporter permease n=1 Tax=Brugia pahangi TaxID=6280 RepID=A0A0N4TBQ0_BRUPA|nr:unnamed protein product [Brugia pahangi]